MMRDNIGRAAVMALCVVVSMVALGALPPQNVWGVELRRVNILSQLIGDIDEVSPVTATLDIDESEFEVDLDAVAQAVAIVHQNRELAAAPETQESGISLQGDEPEGEPNENEITPIEEYGDKMQQLYRKIATPNRTTRIAVLGDSFIEADILTADLRETLQQRYGGAGCGFAPFPTSISKYRRTVETVGEGWKAHNIMQYSTAPEWLANYWTLSGWCVVPTVGETPSVMWRATDARERLADCSSARLLFVARNGAKISIKLNDGESKIYNIKPSPSLQQIECKQDRISSLKMQLLSGKDGFIGYGAIFDDSASGDGGVVVDNYSIRSNNGQAILRCDPTLTAQLDMMVGGYDMIVLQYGLNLLQRGVSDYERYCVQIEKMVDFVKLCHPSAAVVVMGVSDRSIKVNGEFRPIKEAADMIKYQRQAAQNSGVAFWDTHSAMQRMGGMSQFVANNWAAKDYTHINAAGGREIAYMLADALSAGVVRIRVNAKLKQQQGLVEGDKRGEVREKIIGDGSVERLELRGNEGHGSR